MRHTILAATVLILASTACNDRTTPTRSEQPVLGPVESAEYTFHGGPVELPGEYADVPLVAGVTSEKVKWGDNSTEITDTIDGPGFRVEHLYDDKGAVRRVHVERADSNLGVDIVIDATGTVREVRTLAVAHSEHNTVAGYEGWTFMLDPHGKVIRAKSGVTITGRIVRAVGE